MPDFMPRITADFAILDVKGGRKALARIVGKHMPQTKLKIIIEAEIDGIWSGDDGESQEFGLAVTGMRWEAEE